MLMFVTYALFFVLALVIGSTAFLVQRFEYHRRRATEAHEAMYLIEESLGERLQAIDAYRHDLADLVQSVDMELIRTLEEE
jgi:sensor domain CHASE-containing protein